jgi:hypothetical protein
MKSLVDRNRKVANNRLQRTALRAAAEPERWALFSRDDILIVIFGS